MTLGKLCFHLLTTPDIEIIKQGKRFLIRLMRGMSLMDIGVIWLPILPQNALKRDRNSKCIDLIEGHYLEVVVLL